MSRTVEPEVVAEIEHELALIERDPVREAQLVVDAAERRAIALRAASIKQTLASDWVLHSTKSGEKIGYLMDSGCQRTAQLWGVSFAPVKPTDFIEEVLPDSGEAQIPTPHISYSITATGWIPHPRIAGARLERTEMGTRSTAGEFTRRQWEDPKTTSAERHTIKQNVRKAALTNAYGRITRALTGMSRMPADELVRMLGATAAKIPGVDYKTGAKGGGAEGSGIGEKQAYVVAKNASEAVEGYGSKDVNAIKEQVLAIEGLNGKKASGVIDWLQELKGEDKKATKAELWKRLGFVKKAEPEKKEPAPNGEAQPELCPGCKKSPEAIQENGHEPGCASPKWGAK